MNCTKCNGLIPEGDFLRHCGPGATTLCNCKPDATLPPSNNLPTWQECSLIVNNAEFRRRAALGLEGAVLDMPPSTPEPTELHKFIYEYDDTDPYRSAWFLHRLELVLNEAKAHAAAASSPSPEQQGAGTDGEKPSNPFACDYCNNPVKPGERCSQCGKPNAGVPQRVAGAEQQSNEGQ